MVYLVAQVMISLAYDLRASKLNILVSLTHSQLVGSGVVS